MFITRVRHTWLLGTFRQKTQTRCSTTRDSFETFKYSPLGAGVLWKRPLDMYRFYFKTLANFYPIPENHVNIHTLLLPEVRLPDRLDAWSKIGYYTYKNILWNLRKTKPHRMFTVTRNGVFFPLVIPFPFFFSVDTEYDSSPPSLYLQVNFGPSFYTERLSDEFRFYSLNGRKVLYTIVLFKLVQFIFDSSTVDISVVLTAVSEDYVFPPRPQNSSCQYGVISVYATFSTAASYPLAKADR